MANFFFYEDRRKVGPVSASQVKRLAATGCIKPDTIVESEDGKQSSASKLKGLDFSVPSSIEPDTPSAEPDTYGLCVPNIYDKPPETPKQDTAPNTAA
ncbi:MAG: DUF4339 domain-containing protein, partial [Planctomycetaceae bacterium]|nr:DUF4339 domain-containing protein [Planctomycetaceae bacterium]